MNTEKKCFKCGEVKSLSSFYKHKGMADGHVNKCKECNKKDVRDNRKSKVDYYRIYDRSRGSRQTKEYADWYRLEYPRKTRARTIVNNAVRDGRLEKAKFCSECGDSRLALHGHHDDYRYPMIVRWLCPACHKAWHDKNGEAPNGR